ncbi:Carboxysome shell and ethanolamine utilization microcompartment protein CcmL/EutN [Natronincola peptidivorans]|uniref:Carboxysome shell and ethanolamine utilization microcompartment protein CcmL/EutN n=1 Tax=Natronincola peptidivorans TaxID=426128 RepID=A0A1I0CEZ9_9FIRM|nr:BMC domain-containing protein [Natronincola peptidivorans]SET18175.1 Carboxysome shell and ethanolamine utilization microcompartment protein CcmL/EutN [Natronincola peptidivorans]
MKQAIGLIEYKTVSTGITAADKMVKSADVEILQAQTVCPGKYIVLISGKLSAVNTAIENGKKESNQDLIDSFILGNPHDSIFPAMYGMSEIKEAGALGVIETFSAASIIVAADIAAKTAHVSIIEIRVARGMCGKSYLFLSGEVAAVDAAIKAACKTIEKDGTLLNHSVIPNPDEKIWQSIM